MSRRSFARNTDSRGHSTQRGALFRSWRIRRSNIEARCVQARHVRPACSRPAHSVRHGRSNSGVIASTAQHTHLGHSSDAAQQRASQRQRQQRRRRSHDARIIGADNCNDELCISCRVPCASVRLDHSRRLSWQPTLATCPNALRAVTSSRQQTRGWWLFPLLATRPGVHKDDTKCPHASAVWRLPLSTGDPTLAHQDLTL
jgi:transcription initiation factor TFIID subunit TAF12